MKRPMDGGGVDNGRRDWGKRINTRTEQNRTENNPKRKKLISLVDSQPSHHFFFFPFKLALCLSVCLWTLRRKKGKREAERRAASIHKERP